MVEWLAGNRLRGTTAERPVFGLTSGFAGWKEMDRTVIGSDSQTVTVSNLDDYDNIIVSHTSAYRIPIIG
mgnify:CR=1 FL=1